MKYMIKNLFFQLFVNPSHTFLISAKEYVLFVWNMLNDALFVHGFVARKEKENIEETLKTFRVFSFFIVLNIFVKRINELETPSEVYRSLIELLSLLFFFFFTVANYYLGVLMNYIYKEKLFDSIAIKLSNTYSLCFILLLHFSDVVKNQLPLTFRSEIGVKMAGVFSSVILIHMVSIRVKQRKGKWYERSHFFYWGGQYLFIIAGLFLYLLLFLLF